MNKPNLNKSKTLREKLLMIYHDDGILDLVVGISVLILAAVMAFDEVIFIGLLGIPLILYIPIKEQISIPRIGFIRFEAEDISKRRMVSLLVLGLGALVVFALLALIRTSISSNLVEWIGNNEVIIFSVLLAGALFVAGRILNNSRFLIYSILSLVLVLGAYFVNLRIWLPVATVGLVMEVFAISKLSTFLKNNPITDRE